MENSVPGVRRVLVAASSLEGARLQEELLHGLGCRVESVLAGDAALARALSSPPDLLMLGLRLSGMEGWEVLGRLRRDPRTRRLPVLVVSALDDAESRKRAAALGAAGFLPRPFAIQAFREAVARALGMEPARILVVDDDEGMLSYCCFALRQRGYAVELAASGSEALRQLRSGPFDLILTDSVPVPSGKLLLDAVREQRLATPVLAMSADPAADPKDLARRGAKAFLPKPFGEDRLLEAVRGCLHPG